MDLIFDKNSKSKAKELFKAVGSNDREVSWKAQEAVAAFVGPVVDQVLDQSATHKMIYKTIRYDLANGAPSIPIDPYFGNSEGALRVWSQNMPGGLSSNLVSGGDEYRFTTHTINSAISFLKKYASEGRLDVLQKGIERLAQEVLVIQEYQAWYVLLAALGQATTDGATHLISASTAGTFTLSDLNRLMTKAKRLRKSWVGGTPVGVPGKGLTDLFVSPEVIEDIRAMAYNPQNVTATPNTDESTALGLPDAMRLEAWNNAGAPSFFGVKIHEMLEFGVAMPYSHLFDQVYSGSPTFAQATQEFVLGADLSLTSAVLVEGTNTDGGAVFRTEPDDQWVSRSKKIGFWGEAESGLLVSDVKAFTGCII